MDEYYNLDLHSNRITFVGTFKTFDAADAHASNMIGTESVWLMDRVAVAELLQYGVTALINELEK